jgi:hypothetical protein
MDLSEKTDLDLWAMRLEGERARQELLRRELLLVAKGFAAQLDEVMVNPPPPVITAEGYARMEAV